VLTGLSAGLVLIGVLAFGVNFLGAAGGECDESCGGSFPYWLYVGSGWVVMLCVVGLVVVGVVALIRRR
jgi:hypothetical protein